ncbi:MAG: PQQ-dependent sugar dehydrogenase [Puniceicoccaceae bacterium]|nr:MAG: PQQ-dependent sugar dehydrogenase [Puniceicoccaceae bacterium]
MFDLIYFLNAPGRTRCTAAIAGAAGLLLSACTPAQTASEPVGPAEGRVVLDRVETEDATFRVVEVVRGLRHPWAVAFLPDGSLLITERPGRMQRFANGELTEIRGLPEVTAQGQGGLMDVVPHPDFERNGLIYFTYAASYDGGVGTRVARAILEGDRLDALEDLFAMNPPGRGGVHYGSRIVFDGEGNLFVGFGDRGDRHRSQQLDSHHGTVIRIREDGSVPGDNPFVDEDGAHPEIWSYGHRNIQGMILDETTGKLWAHEHGPRGGDELNIVERGVNYGWPVATYGEEYHGGTIGVTPPERDDMREPIAHWTPWSIAPSGLAQYRGDNFPGWEGDLFIGALVQEHIHRVVLDGAEVVKKEEILRGRLGRIRDVRTGPDGNLWVVTDQSDGGVYRIEPVE